MNINKTKEYRYFSVVLKVDVEHLGQAYSNKQTPTEGDLSSVEEMVRTELCWCVRSGIYVKEVEEVKEGESITIAWHIEDVKRSVLEVHNATISDQDAFTVLKYIEKHIDYTYGVSWTTIKCAVDSLLEANLITLLKKTEE